MARISYGAETKKRAKRLLEVLLAYANDGLDCDETALDALRSNIQIRWQSEIRLVVRTKVRFLQALTSLQSGQNPLNAEQIKEALRRFADFLEILEDNRSTRGGSENWHFTLNLWYPHYSIEDNLQRFDREWESRRRKEPGKREKEQEGRNTILSPPFLSSHSPLPTHHPWKEICREMLQNQRRLTTNPLTSVDGVTFELDAVYVPLGLVERKQRDRRDEDISPTQGSRLYETEDTEVTQSFTLDMFLQQVLQQKPCENNISENNVSENNISQKRIAIVGEPGAGKTTLLQKIAGWLLENTEDLPIWVSLADLQGKTLEDYLIQDWLRTAIRKRHVPVEIEEVFCDRFNQKQVWLLLDAVDEMAIESSQALTKIASFLTGWVSSAHVILTSRLNVWDAGKNALEVFDTYRNMNFTYGNSQISNSQVSNSQISNSQIYNYSSNKTSNLVGQFIQRWFQNNPTLGERLQLELEEPGRVRIKDAVKNPLRLALICRTWGLSQGEFPSTKAMLYEKFVETIYEWKQDRFSTTSTQRKQLNEALGKLALQALSQAETKFRLSHRFICQVLGAPDEGMFQLALQIGWLNQVGISENQGEKIYAFYHPTFQEYFAALAVNDWKFFGGQRSISSLTPSYHIFESQWREVILLWLGRDDITQECKDEFIQALTEFDDGCGGYYSYQAYFLAAAGIAEFADCALSSKIVAQLVKWRFGYFHLTQQRWWRFPAPVQESARVALLKTDRAFAIASLEDFIQACENDFDTWNAAYSLGRTFDPGNKLAIATLERLINSIRLEHLRFQAADSLGKVEPGNQIAIAAFIKIIESTKKDSLRRKAAFSLGKTNPGNAIAVYTLENLINSTKNEALKIQALESLSIIEPDRAKTIYLEFNQIEKNIAKSIIKAKETNLNPNINPNTKNSEYLGREEFIAKLEQGMITTQDEETKRRRALKLAQTDMGNPLAFRVLIELVKFGSTDIIRKKAADNFKKVLLDEQIPELITSLKHCFAQKINSENDVQENEAKMEKYRHCYKLIWYCAEKMTYDQFYRAWQS